MDVCKEIVCDIGDGNIVHIDLVSLNEEEQKIEWTFELCKLYLVCSICQLEYFEPVKNEFLSLLEATNVRKI